MNSYDIHMILNYNEVLKVWWEGRMEVTQREFLLPVSQHRILRRHHLPSCPPCRPSDQVAEVTGLRSKSLGWSKIGLRLGCLSEQYQNAMQRKEKMTNSNQTIKHQSDHVALRRKKKRIGPNWLNLPTYEPRERNTAEQKTQRYITIHNFTIVTVTLMTAPKIEQQ